jgi:hypothetical protein
MKRFMIVGAALLLGATFVVADVASAFTPDLPSIYVLCKKHKAGKSGRLIARVGSCRKREVQINPADYPEFIGPQGFEGESGPMGPAGPQGAAGVAGLPGATGPQGLVGPQGPQGLQGLTGEIGPKGETGTPGIQGETGPQGPAGPQGPQGAVGPIGLTGDIGPIGPQGEKGDKGDVGAVGPTGDVGPAGPTGATGAQGTTGATGARGPTGATGPTGETGPQGEKGDPGDRGAPGKPGTTLAARVLDPTPHDPLGTAGVDVNPGGADAYAARTATGYRVTFDSPRCDDPATVGTVEGCDVSNCVFITVFQGLVTSGNPHNASVLFVEATAGDVASVDIDIDRSKVSSTVFSLEAVCP